MSANKDEEISITTPAKRYERPLFRRAKTNEGKKNSPVAQDHTHHRSSSVPGQVSEFVIEKVYSNDKQEDGDQKISTAGAVCKICFHPFEAGEAILQKKCACNKWLVHEACFLNTRKRKTNVDCLACGEIDARTPVKLVQPDSAKRHRKTRWFIK